MRAGLLALLLSSCASGEGAQMLVDLKTDLVPGAEFVLIVAELESQRGEVAEVRRAMRRAEVGDDFLSGLRIAEIERVPPGGYLLTVSLHGPDGREVAMKPTRVEMGSSTLAVQVRIPRSCGPDADPDTCSRSCTAATDCPTPAAACARAACRDGVCFHEPVAGVCGPTTWCDPALGCTPLPDLMDCRTTGCDDGVPCTEDECVDGLCVSRPVHALCSARPDGVCDARAGCQYPTCGDGVCTPGSRRPCSSCPGSQVCDATCRWSTACESTSPELLCNFEDDDCNAATPDDACPVGEGCSIAGRDGGCVPLAPRLDSVEPSSPPRCSCLDLVLRGANFRPAVQGYFRGVDDPMMMTYGPITLVYDSPTQIRLNQACNTDPGAGSYDFWVVDSGTGQMSNLFRYTYVTSAPRIAEVTPSSFTRPGMFCPTFRMEPPFGLCTGAVWTGARCDETHLPPAATLPLRVTTDPRVGVGDPTGGGCVTADMTFPTGDYCLWVVNPDGGESPRTATPVMVF